MKCWEVYRVYCSTVAAPGVDWLMTCRDLLCMFKVRKKKNPISSQLRLDIYKYTQEEIHT